MTERDKLLLECRAWAKEKMILDKGYFERLADMHTPKILWIGSSDSLVPVREVTNTEPGEILVYRNLGTQVRKDDISLMALLQDAVEISKVEEIIVCGYSHCSGIRDVLLGMDNLPMIKEWLNPLRDLYERNRDELDSLPFEQKEKRLSEINIQEQILHLSQLGVIQQAWEKSDFPHLYGWYFDLDDGSMTEVYSMEANQKIRQVARVV
jgi:carbonic anhydrase